MNHWTADRYSNWTREAAPSDSTSAAVDNGITPARTPSV